MKDSGKPLWISLDLDPGVADYLGLPSKLYLPLEPGTPLPDDGLSLTVLGEGLERAAVHNPEMAGHPQVLRFLARRRKLEDLERYHRIGNTAFAAQTARDLLESDPSDPPALAALARRAALDGDLPGALDLYRRVLDRAPTHGPTRIEYALVLAASGDPGTALGILDALPPHPPWGASARLWRYEIKQGRLINLEEGLGALPPTSRSADDLDRLARRFPENPEVLFLRAVHPEGETEETRRGLLEKALAVDPGHLGARLALVSAHAAAGRLDDALRLTDAGPPRVRDSADLGALRGQVLEQQGRRDEARAAYRNVFEQPLALLSRDALLRSAQGLLRVGAPEETRLLLEDAEKARPGDPIPLQFLARLDEAAGDREGAERRLRGALRSCGPLPVLHYALGDLLRRIGRTVEAEGVFKALVQRHPASPWGYRGLGDLRVAEQPSKAIEQYTDALKRDPITPIPGHAYLRGVAELRAGKPEEAAPWLQRAVAGEPDNPRFWGDLAAALFYRGDLEGAVRGAEHARRLAPRNPGFAHNLAVFHRVRFLRSPLRHPASLWRSWRLGRVTAALRRKDDSGWERDIWSPGRRGSGQDDHPRHEG